MYSSTAGTDMQARRATAREDSDVASRDADEARNQSAQPRNPRRGRALRTRPQASVLIIGAGINGIATFRDLALQGVDVVLVERGDFVSGASAASSHMIHGGIRYLENGEFRLVQGIGRRERNALIRIAPHYVKPLQTTVPIFSTFSGILSAPLRFLTHKAGKPTERGAALIKTGLTIYDAFSRDGGSVPRHRFHGRKQSLAELPALNPGIKYTATYYDASMHDPERLALDVLARRPRRGRARPRRELPRGRRHRRATACGCATPSPARSSTSPPTSS